MTDLLPFILVLAAWTGPQVTCGLRIDPRQPVQAVDPVSGWRGLSDRDLMARTILSEQGGRVLDWRDRQVDSVGVAFVVGNRVAKYGSVFAVVFQPGQFSGMESATHLGRVADPERYSRWYGNRKHAGRLAYWTAIAIAQCVLARQLVDPTRGSYYFADGYYARAENGALLMDDGAIVVWPYSDGRTRFRRGFSERSWPLAGPVTWRYAAECEVRC